MVAKSILFVCPYPYGKAPSQRLKFEQYFEYIEANGFRVDQRSFQSLEMWETVYKKGKLHAKIWHTIWGYVARFFLLFRLASYDVVYVHLWVTPFGPPIFEWLYRKFSKKIVYDIDDLVFMENASEANSWVWKVKGKKKPIFLMKAADAIITTTPFLINYCRKLNRHVYGIPPTLDEKKFFPIPKKNNTKLVIGWMGSHSTESYLDIVKQALKLLAQEIDFRLVLMGAEKFTLDNVEITRYQWEAEKENEVLNELDIALYPLRDELWSQGKFGGKLIQYFATGLPCIASDVNDSNRLAIIQEKNGILVNNTTEEWYDALSKLAHNKSLRQEIGIQARFDFLRNYSIEGNKNTYFNIINELVEK